MFIALLLHARLDAYSLLLSSLSYDPVDSLLLYSQVRKNNGNDSCGLNLESLVLFHYLRQPFIFVYHY